MMDGWRAGYYHTLLFLAWNYHKEIVRFRHGIHDRLLDGLEGKFGRGSLGIYSLFVSCLISVFLDQFGWLVWVASAPASCTHSHDRTYNTVRYVLHIHEPLDPQHPPAYTPSLKAVQSSRLQGMEWVRISLSCERALTTHLKANGKPARFLCDFNHLPGFLDSGTGSGPGTGFPPHSPFPIFCFVSFYFIKPMKTFLNNGVLMLVISCCNIDVLDAVPYSTSQSLLPILTMAPYHAMCCGVWLIKCR